MEEATVCLPAELYHALREESRPTSRTQDEVLREALQLYLRHRENQEYPPPRSLGVGEDSELRAADTEDWLEARWRQR